MNQPSPATAAPRPADPSPLWAPPRVVSVAVARPDITPGDVLSAIEWQPRSRADRRL